MTKYQYSAFGLRLESSRQIASLAGSATSYDCRPDVEITEDRVPVPEVTDEVDGLRILVDGPSCFLGIEECGNFQVDGGTRIVVDPEPGATPEQVDLYLLGSVFGALLHQRRLLPFHCNGVEIDGSAFLFCGESGAGKSTLAAYFVDRGLALLSDDVCALHFAADGRLVAWPGVTRLKLWGDTLELFGRGSADLTLVPWYEDKFEVPLAAAHGETPLPVAGIYHLRVAAKDRPSGIHPLKGRAAINSITSNIYRRRLGDLIGAAPAYLAATARIVEQVPIFTINRNWGFDQFGEEAAAIEEHLRNQLQNQLISKAS